MKKLLVTTLLCAALPTFADISLTDRASVTRAGSSDTRGQLRAANQAKRDAKHARRGNQRAGSVATTADRTPSEATGDVQFIDAGGVQYFINTDITFSTSSSASGAASEASYTHATAATTSAGGTTSSTLNDSFDGYNSLCVSLTNATGPCATGNPAYVMYRNNGPGTLDASCANRQVIQPVQSIGPLNMSRRIFVPTDDRYIRWLNTFTNTSGAPITFTMITGNNLGSDSNTVVVTTDDGDAVAETTDNWVTTFQNFSGSTSSDPRLGHILQGDGAATPVSNINFVDGNDNPFWAYSITLAAGQTKSILNFATVQATRALAASEAERISQLPASASQCLTSTDLSQVVNFPSTDLSVTKTSTPAGSVASGQNYSYTVTVTNEGPGTANTITVTDPLPAGVTFVSASGTGWSCSEAAGTVTCTLPTLAVGAAPPITINVTAPLTPGPVTNTATVSSAGDSNPANDSDSVNVTVSNSADLSITKTTSTTTASSGDPITYTLAVTNAGPTAASNVTVTDALPAGSTFVSASGTGWTCGNVANVVTCTRPTLAVGAAPLISLTITAPVASGTLSNTATVSSDTSDPSTGNNAATSAVPLAGPAGIPVMSPAMLALLAFVLSATAWIVIGRRS